MLQASWAETLYEHQILVELDRVEAIERQLERFQLAEYIGMAMWDGESLQTEKRLLIWSLTHAGSRESSAQALERAIALNRWIEEGKRRAGLTEHQH